MSWRWLAILLLTAGVAAADERILDYHSDIQVKADGWIEVTETIRVRAEGDQIRRGIYRDYPTRYEDRYGNDIEVQYEPHSVTRDGRPEAFHAENVKSGVRTYFGSSDVLLPPGEYVYVYRYAAGRMLGFFDDADELWWNVTGNGWSFPIDRVGASVSFEFEVGSHELQVDAWQGPFGSKETGGAAIEPGAAVFEATRPLATGENLSIAVRWPKGYVAEPGDLQKLIWLLSDNVNLLVALAGLAAILGYYIPVWRNYGKDPEPGVLFTRYEPPPGFSPASLRYIDNMGYDNTAMTAAIVNLAVKGRLRIIEDDGKMSLRRLATNGAAPALAPGEQELLEALFRDGNSITLIDDNHEIIGGARKAHERSLKRDYHRRYFRTNGALNLPPLLIAIVASVAAIRAGPSIMVFVTTMLMIATVMFFAVILKKPTGLGRKLMDHSAGFREYLEVAEKDEMNLRNPPDKTPHLFEQYLPFALALGVEQQWAERFSRIFAGLRGPNNSEWHPAWYSGSWNGRDLGANTSGLSSGLGTAISSSVTAPGSSSSGGGGGFSGGGGGGGGGGGW